MRIRGAVLAVAFVAVALALSSVAHAQDAANAKAAATEANPPANKGKYAYVTLLTNIDFGYVIGLEVLAKSIRATGSRIPLVCIVADIMIPNNLRKDPDPMLTTEQDVAVNEILERLHFSGYAIRFGQTITNPNPIVEREWFRSTYTKVHIFALEDYEQIVYLDADMLVLQNIDHLFELNIHRIAAVPDILPPDRFQSGLMVVRPSREVHAQLIQAIAADGQYLKECKEKNVAPDFNSEAAKFYSYDGGDQGFLNAAFSDWYFSDPINKLPFVYNTLASVASLYPPAWRYLHERRITKVIHFSGDPNMKPWFEGERAIQMSLAPYVYVWQSIARVVQAQTARRLQLKQNGEWSPTTAEGQLHPWFVQPPIPEDDPRFKDFVISYTNLGNIIATHDPKVIESWFQPAAEPKEQAAAKEEQEPERKEEL